MKIKKSFLTAVVVLALVAPGIASTPVFDEAPSKAKAISEIRSIVQDIDFDVEALNNQQIKVHFMVNTANEVVVLRTSSDKADNLIKYNLNYKELKSRDLEINKVYILPISFKATS